MFVSIPRYSAADNGFVRAKREGKWGIHLWAFNQMMPYFFAAVH